MNCRLQVLTYRKASRTRQLVVKVERMVTVVQEWLEGEEKLPSKVAGYVVVAVAFLYLIGQVVRCFL